jgi:N-acetylglutamate synthase/N-acetylornithine aminotransferase
LRTVSGTATIYGCAAGAGSAAPNIAANIDIIVTDDGGTTNARS